MEVSGQLHTLAALFQVKGSPETIDKGAWVDSSPDLGILGKKKSFVSSNNQT